MNDEEFDEQLFIIAKDHINREKKLAKRHKIEFWCLVSIITALSILTVILEQ